jgi:hypothetical protein
MTIAVLALAPATSIGFRAIEGAADRTRPILSPGHSWSANGYHCARTTTAVRCRRGTHGFSITLGR